MKKRLTIFFLSLLFISCKKEKIDNPIELKLPEREVSIDTTDGEQFIAILQLEDSKKSINLSKDEIKTVEILLRKSIENYNENFKKKIH